MKQIKIDTRNCPFFFFSDRSKLNKLFEEWCKENNAEICGINMLAFLHEKKLLNIGKLKKIIYDQK